MIASVTGRVGAIPTEVAVIEVGAARSADEGNFAASGYSVGFAVHCTPATLADLRVGASSRLATSLVVREDSLTLYGFADDAERVIFELLQTASGVGPRLAQAALAVHSPHVLRRAIMAGDLATLTAVPGIGKKGAQRIVLELAERVTAVSLPDVEGSGHAGDDPEAQPQSIVEPVWRQQVRQGLLALGWSAKQADEATTLAMGSFERDRGDVPGESDVATVLKAAIAILGRIR